MMDIADAAQEFETKERAAALSNALAPPAGVGLGPDWINGKPCCTACGAVIPSARLHALPGTGLCVDCAAEAQEK